MWILVEVLVEREWLLKVKKGVRIVILVEGACMGIVEEGAWMGIVEEGASPLSPSTPSPQLSISTPPPIPTSPKVYSEREVENMLRNRQYLMINPYIDYGPFVDGLINDMS